jgi:lysophospholipase L1-like esterase
MQEILKDRNTRFMKVIYPIINQMYDKYLKIDRNYVLYPQNKIKAICNDYNIPFLDLTNALYINGGTRLYKDYLHLNEKGNDIVANEATKYLLENMQTWLRN